MPGEQKRLPSPTSVTMVEAPPAGRRFSRFIASVLSGYWQILLSTR